MSEPRVSKLALGGDELVVLSVPTSSSNSALACLTANELAVAQLAAVGRSNREIAEYRGTSQRTVANQLAAIYRKLEIDGRAALAALLGA